MSRKKCRGKRPSERAHARPARRERNEVARLPGRGWSTGRIAAELGRAPPTTASEVAAHRYVTAPISRGSRTCSGASRSCSRAGLVR